uniref:Uncharacterized protein n=1 Tax=Candidatus Kentrum sp. LFY TaxID=2126342 RepID=A0A450UYR0_9GAMM|nr:MAG: hypothetical protein BECKLFY1418B_GA0070995_11063 [Candidatus Kentron sp. LFY]
MKTGSVKYFPTVNYNQKNEAAAEDEAAFEVPNQAVMDIPMELVPEIRRPIATHKTAYEQ